MLLNAEALISFEDDDVVAAGRRRVVGSMVVRCGGAVQGRLNSFRPWRTRRCVPFYITYAFHLYNINFIYLDNGTNEY
jgi:hypothetical protein